MSRNHCKAMLSAENRATQVEPAILTLYLADNRLRAQEEPESKVVFSALSAAIRRKKGDVHKLGLLLSRLFKHQHASIKDNQVAKPFPKINSQLKELLKTAGFEIPEFGDAKG